jgi:hypothetical protein
MSCSKLGTEARSGLVMPIDPTALMSARLQIALRRKQR